MAKKGRIRELETRIAELESALHDCNEKQFAFALNEMDKRIADLWKYHTDSMEFMVVDSAIREHLQGLDIGILTTRIGTAKRLITKDELLSLSDQLSVFMNRFQFLADKLKLAPDVYQGVLSEISSYREGIRRFCNEDDGGEYLEHIALNRDPNKASFVAYRDSLNFGRPKGTSLVLDWLAKRLYELKRNGERRSYKKLAEELLLPELSQSGLNQADIADGKWIIDTYTTKSLGNLVSDWKRDYSKMFPQNV